VQPPFGAADSAETETKKAKKDDVSAWATISSATRATAARGAASEERQAARVP